ncbi:DUF6193 family natural product biosynthesis protein [Streptomyces qinzhouensis]|uniref:Uncharacterized protein n=1 Tax=Streptomyces qinzhouensis TaxID=2599401 RepID=A0A5B8JAI0_9ACTN|nr:DUF6193 family natural product biosynthesis protein [Streptomyces qinzhouensis]QDY78387.1 hypothetical protein FQU76_19930 [Streptomyces qinzhouensis]
MEEISNRSESPGESFETYYSDVLACGGLGSAIVRAARENGLVVESDSADPEAEGQELKSAVFDSPRGPITVGVGFGERRFRIVLESGKRFFHWASGSAHDLVDVARVIHSWRAGLLLEGLVETYPFMAATRLGQGWENGDFITVQWDIVAADSDFADYREVIRLMRSSERLRRLFPYFSHWVLRLTDDPGNADSWTIFIRRDPAGSYELWSSYGAEGRQRYGGVEELVDATVELLGDRRGRSWLP